MKIGGYNDVPDWPKRGPSLLIATCLIVAIRTARWSATIDTRNSNTELELEVDDLLIQGILRHSDVSVTRRSYIKTVPMAMTQAMQKLERAVAVQ